MNEAAIGWATPTPRPSGWCYYHPRFRILTGVMLAIAREAGETAPLPFTALFSTYWLSWQGHLKVVQPTALLAELISWHALREPEGAWPGRPPRFW